MILLCFAIFATTAVIYATASDTPKDTIHAQFILTWVTSAIGLFLAIGAGLGMLAEAVTGGGRRAAIFAMPALIGLMLISPQWGTALALSVAAAAFAVESLAAARQRSAADEP